MHKRGMLIIISGPSGVGKDTVVNRYLQKNQNYVLSVSATTREPRAGEHDGVHYFYESREEFSKKIKNGDMLEYAEYNGNFYGTPADNVEKMRAEGKNVILVIEVKGAKKVKKLCPEAVLVFIMPPTVEELRNRLKNRGTEAQEVVDERMRVAVLEMEEAFGYDYVLVNENIDECMAELEKVFSVAARSPKHAPEILKGE